MWIGLVAVYGTWSVERYYGGLLIVKKNVLAVFLPGIGFDQTGSGPLMTQPKIYDWIKSVARKL